MVNKISFLLLFFSLISFGQNEKNYVLFSGNIKNTQETIIKISNYEKSIEKDVMIDALGNFKDTLYIKEDGNYYYQSGKSYSSMFLRKGDDLYITLDADDFYRATKYTGKGSLVNNYHVARSTLKASFVGDPKDYFVVPVTDFLQKIAKEKLAFLDLLETWNLDSEDKEVQRKVIEHDYLQIRNSYDKFNFYHTQIHPELPLNYYDPIKNMYVDDEQSFKNNGSYRNMVVENWRLGSKDAQEKDPNLSIIDYTKQYIKDLKSTKIKDYVVSMLFKQMNAKNENFEKDYVEIMSLLTNDYMKEKLTTRYQSANATKPEMASVGFDYENYAGGKTSLEDLKGKIVYVEIWATWCGPCIKEMPYLTEIIKEYKDNENIVFVNISIDAINEYDKWRAMVPEKNVGGIQLLADNGLQSEFMKFYSVGLIPRSIMLDAEGNIISQHAPRPSSKDIRTFINDILNKKATTFAPAVKTMKN
jgi:thiol-disulfide isomerase/thioredoxin